MILAFFVLLFSPTAVFARGRLSGFCEQGNQTISVLGYTSSSATPVQRSYPACTVTVYLTGTLTVASIYADNSGTALANPFTLGVAPELATNGYWFFYADNGAYDIKFSGTGLATPFNLTAVSVIDPASGGTVTTFSGSGPSWLTWTVTNPTTTPAASLAPTTGQTSGRVIGTCGSATTFAPCALVAGDLPSLAGLYLPITGGTLTGNLLFGTDNTRDIGASGATRPRDFFLGRNAVVGGTIAVTGHTTFEGVTSTGATGAGALVYSISPTLVTPALGTPSAIILTNATGCVLNTCATAAALNRAHGGLNSTSAGTGIIRDGTTPTASELSGDATTSGSNAVTVTGLRNTPFAGTNGDLVSFGAANIPVDSGVVAANVVTAAAAATAAKKIGVSSGASKTLTYIDLPNVQLVPAARCTNATASALWSIPAGGTVTCRAGTNNLGGYIAITDTASTFAQFSIVVPQDWNTAVNPYIRFQLSSADTTVGNTIIPQIRVSCEAGDGSTTDDVTLNAAHSLSTVTLNATANQFWSTSNIQMNGTDVTGCAAGSMMIVQVGRATDTATSAYFYSATVTFPRLLTVQAN